MYIVLDLIFFCFFFPSLTLGLLGIGFHRRVFFVGEVEVSGMFFEPCGSGLLDRRGTGGCRCDCVI